MEQLSQTKDTDKHPSKHRKVWSKVSIVLLRRNIKFIGKEKYDNELLDSLGDTMRLCLKMSQGGRKRGKDSAEGRKGRQEGER